MLGAGIANVSGIANIADIADVADIATGIADIVTDIADIITDIADIVTDIAGIANRVFINKLLMPPSSTNKFLTAPIRAIKSFRRYLHLISY